jgi:hypothetical protein
LNLRFEIENEEASMVYYARFERRGPNDFRFDTRIYLRNEQPDLSNGTCIGAIIGKNPGSAVPNVYDVLAPIPLNGDKMLPSVRNRFVSAFKLAGKPIPVNAYVRVWNLFYLRDPDLNHACSVLKDLTATPRCATEKHKAKILWLAWGQDDDRLNHLKARFKLCGQSAFYYCHRQKLIVPQMPSTADFAKHPQGMPANPVIAHLATLV